MTPEQAETLAREFQIRFDADVDFECVNGKDRYRFAVVSPRFDRMTQLQRQDALWAAVDAVLPRELTLDVSLILAFAPAELAETGESR